MTLSESVTTGGTAGMRFVDASGVFHGNKMVDAMRTAGILTARTTAGSGSNIWQPTRFGFGDQALRIPGRSTSVASSASLLTDVDKAILRGSSMVPYFHSFVASSAAGTQMLESEFTAFADGLASRRDANTLSVMTVPAWHARDVNGAATLPF